eukprot:2868205-Pyramimonas_sp.AAC.1
MYERQRYSEACTCSWEHFERRGQRMGCAKTGRVAKIDNPRHARTESEPFLSLSGRTIGLCERKAVKEDASRLFSLGQYADRLPVFFAICACQQAKTQHASESFGDAQRCIQPWKQQSNPGHAASLMY